MPVSSYFFKESDLEVIPMQAPLHACEIILFKCLCRCRRHDGHVSHLGLTAYGRFHLSTALPFEGEELPETLRVERIPRSFATGGPSWRPFPGEKWAEFPSRFWAPDHSAHSTSTVVSWLDSQLILLGGAGCAHLEKWFGVKVNGFRMIIPYTMENQKDDIPYPLVMSK